MIRYKNCFFLKMLVFQMLLVELDLKNTYQPLDFAWERRVKFLYRYMLELEKLMWNLSTLGGAYSAMGDFDCKYVRFLLFSKLKKIGHRLKLLQKSQLIKLVLQKSMEIPQFWLVVTCTRLLPKLN